MNPTAVLLTVTVANLSAGPPHLYLPIPPDMRTGLPSIATKSSVRLGVPSPSHLSENRAGFRNRLQALNAVLRGRCGFLDVGQSELADFSAAWRQAKDVSDDVRTLAKSVVLGKLEISAKDRALLRSASDLINHLSREMGLMKDAARTRHGRGFTPVIKGNSDA